MTNREKILNGLEKLAGEVDQELKIRVERSYVGWMIVFSAGEISVQTTLDGFVRNPESVLEPFGEELIKRLL